MVAPRRTPSPHVGPDPRLYEELEKLPQRLTGEILSGRLIASPRPASPHTLATSGLGALLTTLFHFGGGGPGGWIILDEPELHLGSDVLVPDVAGWRRSRMPEIPNVAAFTLAPDWVCEGISPSTEHFDRGEKLPAYAAHGVRHAWLIDGTRFTLEVFRNHRGTFQLVKTYKGKTRVRAEPFEAAEIDLGLLWIPGPTKASRSRGKKP